MSARRIDDRTGQASSGPARPGLRRPVPIRPARRRTAGSVFTALGALVALAVLLAGVPAVLLYGTQAVASMGDPAAGGPTTVLTSPDDGRLFLWALVAVGWAAWLCFLASVLLEIPAQLRGRLARRIPAFGWSQRLAAGLVGSVLALLPVAGSAFAAVPDRAQTAAAPAQLAPMPLPASVPAALPAADKAADQHPTYTVRDTRPADSLWSIAERRLGAGERWTEIAKLNDGRLMEGSGVRFDADRPIQPGWQLLMPTDAKPDDAAQPSHVAPPLPKHPTVTVHSGDTLSGIAQRELGNADDWPKLFEVNKGVSAPDGARLTDPNLVEPGMVLALPGAAPAAPAQPVTPDPAPPAEQPPAAAAQPTPAPPAATTPATPSAQPTQTDVQPTTPPPSPHAADPRPAAAAVKRGSNYTPELAASTIGVVLAAVMVSVVARRRTDQQRARRPRHRIALPSGPAAAFEAELTVRQSSDGLELLNRALRTLARNTIRTGKRLPALVAARVTTGRTVELHLAAPAVPIAPFHAAHAPNVWWCSEDSNELLSTAQAVKTAAPYPALVTLGNSPDGSVVFSDLETVRLVHLSGHPEDSADVLRTLAIDLAHSPLADRLNLHLIGFDAALPMTGPAADRVHHHESLEAALAVLAPRTARTRATLIAAELPGPREARSQGRVDEAWVPEIVLSAEPPTGSVPSELGRLLDGRPRTCLAVVTRAPERGAGPVARWTLPSTGQAALPGLHFGVELQRLSREQVGHLDELVRTSGDLTQHPAPDWTLEGPGTDPEPTELPLPVPVLAALGGSEDAPGDATEQQIARVIGTGVSPFAGIAPTVTPVPSARHHLNSRGLHAVPTEQPSPATPEVPPAPRVPEPAPMHGPTPAEDAHGVSSMPTRPAPRPGNSLERTDSDDLLAILHSPEAHSPRTAPRIRVLGPVDIHGATGTVDADGEPHLAELAAFIALRPGTDPETLDRDLHPGAAHLATGHRSGPLPAKLAALTGWLGNSTEGHPFLPTDLPDGYTMAPTVSCDWDEFRSLYRRGMRSTSTQADAALAHALALVRGVPFAEASAGAYSWVEPERQDMIAAIVDTAHELAARRLQYGDHRTAEAAIFRALAVAPEIELLHRDLFYTYASAGARDQLLRAVNRLHALSHRTGRPLDPDTIALLRDLVSG